MKASGTFCQQLLLLSFFLMNFTRPLASPFNSASSSPISLSAHSSHTASAVLSTHFTGVCLHSWLAGTRSLQSLSPPRVSLGHRCLCLCAGLLLDSDRVASRRDASFMCSSYLLSTSLVPGAVLVPGHVEVSLKQ